MSINVCNDRSMASITSFPSGVSGSSLVLISTQTASSSSTINFTSGIDSTYKEYVFKIINCHPASDEVDFSFQGSTNTGSSYGVTMTSTGFSAYHNEAGSAQGVGYEGQLDQAQGTGFHQLSYDTSNDNDHCINAELFLFDPSNTTFVKSFMHADQNMAQTAAYSSNAYAAGYINTTSAVNAIQFKFHSGAIDSGTIIMYGVS